MKTIQMYIILLWDVMNRRKCSHKKLRNLDCSAAALGQSWSLKVCLLVFQIRFAFD